MSEIIIYTTDRVQGRINKKQADEKTNVEYDEFNKAQKINLDFDKQIKKMIEKGGENNE